VAAGAWKSAPMLVAPDAFKGTLSAPRVASAIGRGLQAAGLAMPDLCPVADGGEGSLEVLLEARGGHAVEVRASDPLGRSVSARFGLLGDGFTAVVEMAQASGLHLVSEADRDAVAATSAGTGELIVAAVAAGARRVLVTAGGSATTDGGRGALAAIEAAGGLQGARLVVLCDVRTPFEQAARRFGPQKGATDSATLALLERRLTAQARRLARDPRGRPMTGAAGGLAGGLWSVLDAELEPGASFILGALDFEPRLRRARAVVVGEGSLDRSTLEGKVAGEIAMRARQAGVPAHAIVGQNNLDRFDARILDLQMIFEAGDETALQRAGSELAGRL